MSDLRMSARITERVLCAGVMAAALLALAVAPGARAQSTSSVPVAEKEGDADEGAFDRFRDDDTGAASPATGAVGFERRAGGVAALPVDLPVLGYKERDVNAISARTGAVGFDASRARTSDIEFSFDRTGKWYSQNFETVFGVVLVEGERVELSSDSPMLSRAMAKVGRGAPASVDAPYISYGGDDYTDGPTEVSASFEVDGFNYRVTLTCDPDGPQPTACEDDKAILTLVNDLRMLDEGRKQ